MPAMIERMRLTRDSLQLFGLDLAGVLEHWREGLREAQRWPWVAWLSSPEPVRLLQADGVTSIRRGASAARLDDRHAARALAIEVPGDMVLSRQMAMPGLALQEMEAALQLQAQALSPFAGDDLAWGWRRDADAANGVRVTLAMASRAQIGAFLQTQSAVAGNEAEVWFDESRPVVFSGFGEAARLGRERWWRRRTLLAAGLVPLLAFAVAATPVWQSRVRADQADARLEQLRQTAAPSIRMREELVKLGEVVVQLRDASSSAGREIKAIDDLSRVLPDDASLTRLDFRNAQVRLVGVADNAAQILQLLGDQPEFREVRTSAPFSRNASGKESFTIDLELNSGGAGK